MKYVIFVKNSHKHAGIGRVAINCAETLMKQGHTVTLISEGGDYDGDQIVVDYTAKNFFRIVKNLLEIYSLAKHADYLLSYDVKPTGIYAYLIALFSRKPLLLHCIGTYSMFTKHDGRIKSFLMRKVYLKSSKIFILSSSVKRAILKDYYLEKIENAPILPPGVMTDFFYKVQEKPKSLPAHISSYIITVGEIKSRKAQNLSLAAFFEIADEYPELHYVFVGAMADNQYCNNLKKKVESFGLTSRVHFLQGVDDQELRRLYSQARFFVMTPRTTENYIEGFGIVYLEAALCEITSLGTFGSGAEDAIVNDKTGKLCHDSAESIAYEMRNLLNSEEERQVLAQQAKRRAAEFSWDKIVENYIIVNND